MSRLTMSPCSCCPMRDRCDHKDTPEEIRREVCSWFELAERYGVKCCGSCDWYQCDIDKPICQNYLTTKEPDGFCDEWEERTNGLQKMEEECLQDIQRIQVKISLLKANSGKHRGMNIDAQISGLEDILTELRLKIKMCRKRQEAA